MRYQSRECLQKILDKYGPFKKVLEVGSMHVNGVLRDMFGDEYLGVDMRSGGNVDQVVNGHDLLTTFGKEQFDLVFCFDTMEHDDMFWVTMENMKGVLKTGGWLVIGVPGRNCPEHDHPNDYWRFMPQGISWMMDGLIDVELDVQVDDPNHKFEDEIYAWGKK